MKEKVQLQSFIKKINLFYNGNGRMCKISFANDDTMNKNLWTNLNYI